MKGLTDTSWPRSISVDDEEKKKNVSFAEVGFRVPKVRIEPCRLPKGGIDRTDHPNSPEMINASRLVMIEEEMHFSITFTEIFP